MAASIYSRVWQPVGFEIVIDDFEFSKSSTERPRDARAGSKRLKRQNRLVVSTTTEPAVAQLSAKLIEPGNDKTSSRDFKSQSIHEKLVKAKC